MKELLKEIIFKMIPWPFVIIVTAIILITIGIVNNGIEEKFPGARMHNPIAVLLGIDKD